MALAALLKEEQARYKIEVLGASHCTDVELIAMLTGMDLTAEQLDVIRKVMNHYNNNLTELTRSTIPELVELGLSMRKAKVLQAAFELFRRRKQAEARDKVKIMSSLDSYNYISPYLYDLNHEEFYAIFMDRGNKIIRHKLISRGGIAGTVVDTKILFGHALSISGCAAMVIAHNHPSGSNKPSDADITLTKRVVECGKLLDIVVLDHLIIAGTTYFSFADEGKI